MSNDSSSTAADVEHKQSRSCDPCRRKKSRCDRDESARGTKCKRCIARNFDTRVQQLERRQHILQTLLKRFLPNTDLSGDFDVDQVSGLLSVPEAWGFDLLTSCRVTAEHSDLEIDDEDTRPASFEGRFYGEYSSEVFALAWKVHQQSTVEKAESPDRDEVCNEGHQPVVLPWEEHLHLPNGHLIDITSFPEPSLLSTLIDLYFTHVNLFLPLLHQPTFTTSLKLELHLTDVSFARVVLLVCAIAARFCLDDPRVLSDGYQSTLSAGWKWFKHAQRLEERMLAPASLYEIQACCLGAEFLRGAGSASVFWKAVGIGLRRAQDVGIHRWKSFGNKKSAGRELWVRAWWCLIVMDRIASAATGQSSSASSCYDFDTGLPTDCDDEFWDHPDPDKAWKQPDGVPSKVAFFISHIRQTAILSSVLEYQYANNKFRLVYLVDLYEDMDRKLVVELDSAVNKWIDTIPEHLRNPGTQSNPAFHRQSIALHAELYFLQILMHRPFLASPDRQSTLTSYSVAICTNAARACSRLLDVVGEEGGKEVLYRIQWPVFSAAVGLLLSIWTSKQSRSEELYPKEMINVEKCVAMLRYSEKCWQSAGQNVDILESLISATDLSSPSSQPSSTHPPSGLDPLWSENPASAPSSGDAESVFNSGVSMFNDDDFATMPSTAGSYVNTSWDSPNTLTSNSSTSNTMAIWGGSFDTNTEPAAPPPPTGLHESTIYHPDAQLDPGLMGLHPESSLLDSHTNLFDIDPDTFAMLSKAPLGLDVRDWKTYVDGVSEMQGLGGRVT